FGRGNSFESQRLIGELDVSEVPVTHTKDSLVWDSEDEPAFLDALAGALDAEPLPLLRMARNYRSTERGRAVQTTVQNVVETVARAVSQPIPDASGTVGATDWTDDLAAGEGEVAPAVAETISL